MRVNKFARLIFLGALVCGLASGCSQPGAEPTKPQVTVQNGVAILDPQNVSVQLPLSIYTLDVDGQRKLLRAQDLLIEDCMISKGIQTRLPDRLSFAPVGFEFGYYGVWVPEQAAQFGYQRPPKPAGYEKLGEWESSLSENETEIAGTCMDNDEWRNFDLGQIVNSGPTARGERESYTWAKQDAAWTTKVDSYQSCMTKLGYQFQADQPFAPTSATSLEGEQAIDAALDDVACKQQVNLVQGLSDLVAAYEKDFISKNEATLVEQKQQVAEKLRLAEALIAQHALGH